MTYREVPHYLINKYHLSPEDTEDVRNEIAISDLEYGYQRNIEHIIIDYFEKTKHYKRNHKTGKREFKAVFIEYAEVSSESDSDGRVTTAISSDKYRNYGIGYESTELVRFNSKLAHMNRIIEQLPTFKKAIFKNRMKGITLKQIGNQMGVTESRIKQHESNVINKMWVLSLLDDNVAVEVAKVIKW